MQSSRPRPARSSGPVEPTRRRSTIAVPRILREVALAGCRLTLCYATAVGAKEHFPFDHWFWVPLTVCLVMKPDFGSVFSRAPLRAIGTVAAAVIATVSLLLAPRGGRSGLPSVCCPPARPTR